MCHVVRHLPVYLSDKIEQVQKIALYILFPNTHYNVALDARRIDLCFRVWHSIRNHPESRLHRLLLPLCAEIRPYNLHCSNKVFYQFYIHIECFHMTSRQPYWCPKTMKWRPCWCPKPVLWDLNSFLMQALSFVAINLHRCWPRECKYSIYILGIIVTYSQNKIMKL